MKLKKIRIMFQEPISEEQENVLIVNIKAVRDHAKTELEKRIGQAKNKIIQKSVKDQADAAITRMEYMINSLEMYVSLNIEEARKTYVFQYPMDSFQVIPEFTAFGMKVRLMDMKPDRKIICFIKNDVLKDMGIDRDTVTFEVEEAETS